MVAIYKIHRTASFGFTDRHRADYAIEAVCPSGGALGGKIRSSLHANQAVSPQPLIEHEVRPAKDMLVEPLSERELEVLKLLRSELSGPEIAQELIVSLSTVRTHTQNIYAKLGVNNRRAAVRRAEELDLL